MAERHVQGSNRPEGDAAPYSDLEIANHDHLREGIEVTYVEKLQNAGLLPTQAHALDAAHREPLEAYHPQVGKNKDSQGLIVVNERNTEVNSIEKRTSMWKRPWTLKRIFIIAAIVVVVIAAIVGGVVGSIVHNRHITYSPIVILDGTTTPLNANFQPQLGRSTVNLPQIERTSGCIAEQGQYNVTWQCLGTFNISQTTQVNDFKSAYEVVFDDATVQPQNLRYGPQPPDFNSSAHQLEAATDNLDPSLGTALYSYSFFDKLVIVPEPSLNNSTATNPSASPASGDSLRNGDRPLFCYWNATLAEYFVYPEYPNRNLRRNTPVYPGKLKYIEKRVPDDAVQPYCQQMQVLDDWELVPLALAGNLDIRQLLPQNSTLASFCSCEWFNG